MAHIQTGSILEHLRKLTQAETAAGRTDAELLTRFTRERDELAFAALMARHGPMVLGLCRRILRHTHDAEDAFQATFLVLARMAGSIRKSDALGSWLYGIANRIARKACKGAMRRRELESRMPPMAAPDQSSGLALRDLQAVLDEEINRLSEKYRAAFALCCLESKSRAEAAQELNWKEGTLASRLAHARLLLQRRLTRRGVTLSAALGAMAVSAEVMGAAVPLRLATTTLTAALQFACGTATAAGGSQSVAFARRFLHAALLNKLKRAAMVLVALVLLPTGAGLAAWHRFAKQDGEAAPTVGDVVAVAGEQEQVRRDAYGDPLPEYAVRRFGTLRLRRCGPVTFTPNGKLIVTAGGPALAQVVFWDRATARETRRLDSDSSIRSLHFSPDGTRLAAMRGSVFSNPVWDVESGKVLFTFRGERGTFTRDGRHLFGVHSSPDGPAIGRWEVAGGKETGVWTMPADARAVSCSPDGKTAAFVLGDSVVLFDLDGKVEKRRWAAAKMQNLAFGPDGQRLAAWNMRGMQVWDVAGGQQVFAWDRIVTGDVIFSGDGKQLAWTGYDERSIQYPWVVEFGQAQPRRLGLPINNLPGQAAFAPDGKTLAVNTDASAVELRDLVTGRDALPLDANTGRIFGLALTPDGRHLATFDNHRVLVWEKATAKLRRRFPDDADAAAANQPAMVWDVRLADDGQLRRGNANNTYGHWEEIGPPAVERLQKLGLKDESGRPAFANFEGTVLDVLESPGGQHVAVRISAQPVGQFDRHARIVVRIWDTRTGLPLTHLQPPDSSRAGAFSPDNRVLVTTSMQTTVQLWDLATGQERMSLKGHLGQNIYSVLFTPDNRFLFTGGDDSQVLQWDLTGRALDGVWRTVQHEPKKQQGLWQQLANADVRLAYPALWELAADPAGTVAFMESRLKPVDPPNAKEVADLVAQLDSDIFATRQEAHDRIRKIGEPAVPALRTAMAKPAPLEQARRLEKLIGDLAPAAAIGEPLRSLRAIEILEHIATPDARRLLSKLSQGLPGVRLTQAATESLARMDAR